MSPRSNQRASRGVTPANNSAVLYWKAIGPKEIKSENRGRYFAMLGMAPLPEKGDYFIAWSRYVADRIKPRDTDYGMDYDAAIKKQTETEKQLDVAVTRPWSKKEFPVLADWLAANEKPLAMLAKASNCPRRYDPYLSDKLLDCLIPGLNPTIAISRALVARAMLRLADGKVEDAWADLLTCHRLARLAGQGPILIDILVARAFNGMANRGDSALLQHVPLTATQAAKMRGDLGKLPPMDKVADKFDAGERFFGLDCMAIMAREGSEKPTKALFDTSSDSKKLEAIMNCLGPAGIDWNLIFRTSNSFYDRMVDAYRKPTRDERISAIGKINKEVAPGRKIAAVEVDAPVIVEESPTQRFPSDRNAPDVRDRASVFNGRQRRRSWRHEI